MGEKQRRRPAFHVDGAAPIDAAIDDVPGQRIVLPHRAVADREHVEMAVEHEMMSR